MCVLKNGFASIMVIDESWIKQWEVPPTSRSDDASLGPAIVRHCIAGEYAHQCPPAVREAYL